MAIPVGTNTLTSISRRFIVPEVQDLVYNSNVLFYRLNASNRKVTQGGTQIEVPLAYARIDSAGNYVGFDLLDTTPQDVIKNAAWDWRQKYVTITVDGLTVSKNDSPESIANLLRTYFELGRMRAEDMMGTGIFSNGSDTQEIDGLAAAIDDGTTAAVYGGLGARTTTNAFWQPAAGAFDTTTAVLSLGAMQNVFGAATQGARHPTLIVATQANYNRYWALTQVQQRFPTQPVGSDEQLASAGFTNLLFDNVPFAVDSHVPANNIFFLNEEYIELRVLAGRDWTLGDFQEPVNQDAAVAKMLWAGQLIVKNILRQGRMTAVAA